MDLGTAISRYQASVDDYDREMAPPLGVNETDLRCLEILLQDDEEAPPTLLAARLGLSTGSVTVMIDRLESWATWPGSRIPRTGARSWSDRPPKLPAAPTN